MRINQVYRVFSFVLLWTYAIVILQQGLIDGIHFLSHTSEILSDNFSFHSHGSGKFHLHHHGFMETVEKILHHDDHQDNQGHDQIPFQQQQIKLHLPGYFYAALDDIDRVSERNDGFFKKLLPISMEVLTPPPKGA